ncbi:hypothetical protein Vafri_1931 [Volvox africanus]|nr:hypothetical protein Vafri_1931 [Volvox africanus]
MLQKRGKANDVQKIKALEPCKLDGSLQFADFPPRLCPVRALESELCNCKRHTVFCDTTSNRLEVQFPMGLAIGAAASGQPDLRIELVRLRWGNTGDTSAGDHQAHLGDLRTSPWGNSPRSWAPTHSNQLISPWDKRQCTTGATSGREAQSSAASAVAVRRTGDHHHHGRRSGGAASSIGRYSSTTGALLLFSVLHRDTAAAVGPSLVLPGLAVLAAELTAAVVTALVAAVPPLVPRAATDPDPDPDPCSCWHRLTASDAGREGELIPLPPSGRNWRRRLGTIKSGLGRVSRSAASSSLKRLLGASALLSLAARTWRVVHASSAALAEAVADLTAVGLSYSCLARQAQLGRLPPGRTREMAWRKLHKTAAQRLARHLGDLPAQPPLGPALAALQRCSIAAGLAVDGVPLCGARDALEVDGGCPPGFCESGGGSGGDSGGGGSQQGRRLSLSFSYSRRRRKHPRRGHGPAAAAAAAAATRTDTVDEHLTPKSLSLGVTSGRGGGSCDISTTAGDTRSSGGGCVVPITATVHARQVTPETRFSKQSAVAATAVAAAAALNDPRVTCSRPTESMVRSPPPYRTPPRSGCEEVTPPAELRDQGLAPPKPLHTPAASQSPPSSTTPASSELPDEVRRQTAARRLLGAAAAQQHQHQQPLSISRDGGDDNSLATWVAAPPVPTHLQPAAAVTAAAAATDVSAELCGSESSWGSAVSGSTQRHPAISPRLSQVAQGDRGGPLGGGIGVRTCPMAPMTPDSRRPVGPSPIQGTNTDSVHAGMRTGASNGLDCTDGAGVAEALAAAGPPSSAFLLPWDHTSPCSDRDSHQQQETEQEPQPPLRGPVVAKAQVSLWPVADDSSVMGGGGRGSGGGEGGRGRGRGGEGCNWELPPLTREFEERMTRLEQEEVEALGLPLYGRTDHADVRQLQQRPMGPRERLSLASRAAYLLLVFAPFLTLGVAMLLLAAVLYTPASGGGGGGGGGSRWLARLARGSRRGAWWLLLYGCRRGGAAFIKWGQWAATRVDLFPDDFCETLSQLHEQAPKHSFSFTRRQIKSAFGVPVHVMFEAFDPRPVASGSIAQVHRAFLRCSDGRPLEVAVKVVHPRVEIRIRQDFALLQAAAAALGRLPALRSLSLAETLSQFSRTMTAQADLRVEAAHLRRFHASFSRVASQVTTPRPLPGLVRQEVMVESWEVGRSVGLFVRQPGPLNTEIVCLGVDTYLKMLLQDNFVHTDLHPGNIMVRLVGPDGRPLPPEQQGPIRLPGLPVAAGGSGAAVTITTSSIPATPTTPITAPKHISYGGTDSAQVQLVLLDFGLAEELTPVVRHHFISFLHHLLRGDGGSAAVHLLCWTSRRQACPDPPAFIADMEALAAARCDVYSTAGIDLDDVMKSVLRLARKHAVTIDSCYASLVIAVCVIVGFATSLDPWVNLVDAAVPAMLAHALTGRVLGRLYS